MVVLQLPVRVLHQETSNMWDSCSFLLLMIIFTTAHVSSNWLTIAVIPPWVSS